ncbi:MAG: selenide, water dikinase SelD [Bdellovibrionales bacterium RIFCSPHIGHO2_01_FULL_40_29]|nr:MAG: selenide, water dikinase SelD [Bdellovibrionales bacterium RIFCSPHIGHO2_01_FULL_40_29]OFZ32724.1 MAG: selenide, water dikinase SelD [Bdellovibrionales bacterium RIFCSPHIGHO2_02_FULL_40_15]
MNEIVRLTQTVQKGGCAAKVPAVELRQILARVRFPKNSSDILVDGSLMDDAAVIKVSEDLALVQTLDFFTPIVDSPYVFGQIAAANALSDVYAMGGVPKTAMAVLAFPLAQFSQNIIAEVLQGASDKIGEAGASFIGGHSIDDDTLKFGLSVTGYVHPQKIWSNATAIAGDRLILTKPLGTGTATAALKRGEVTEKDIATELNSMSQLNSILNILGDDQKYIHAATDITGFGLLGHSLQMAKASEKTFEFNFSKIPHFSKTFQLLEAGFLTKAHRSNSEYVKDKVTMDLNSIQQNLLCDPQTSGGLLLSVSAERAEIIVEVLRGQFSHAAIIGSVQSQNESALVIR